MTWTTSPRKQELPSNWYSLRKAVKTRAHGQCEQREGDGQRCPTPGTDCDHINGRDDHSMGNLQWLCSPHHKLKTIKESQDARAKRRGDRKRPVQRHPGA